MSHRKHVTISEAWKTYREILPANAGAVQISETQKAFYAGAWSMLEIVKLTGNDDVSEAEGASLLECLSAEMNAFEAAARNQAKPRNEA